MQTFKVSGMTCGHCERAVMSAIKALDSEAHVQVDLPSGQVQVRSALSEAQLREAIESEGFQVS